MSRADQVISQVDGGVARSIGELVRETLDCELEDLTKEELEEIDEAIFTCEVCGWTMPTDDEADDGVCRECQDD